MKNGRSRVAIIAALLVISFIFNIYFFIENKNFKENRGDEVSDLSDIVLVLIPRDILEIINQQENISDEDFARISGEFRVGIVFYWLSNGIPEIENYFRNMESKFIQFKKAYKESSDKNSEEIKILKNELNDICERGLELYDELNNYFDKHFDNQSDDRIRNKKYRIWYNAYRNKEHEIRRIITETLGKDRTVL